jgi:hypothetical protein
MHADRIYGTAPPDDASLSVFYAQLHGPRSGGDFGDKAFAARLPGDFTRRGSAAHGRPASRLISQPPMAMLRITSARR